MSEQTEAESTVRETVLDVYQAIQSLDAEKLDSYFSTSEDLLAFGQQWESRSKTWDEVAQQHHDEFKALKSITMTSHELEVHARGNFAWTADRAHQVVETNDGKRFESNGRVTLVLEKQAADGNWLIVQWHASRGL